MTIYNAAYCPRIKNADPKICIGTTACSDPNNTQYYDATNSACITDTIDAINSNPKYLIPPTPDELSNYLMLNPTYKPLISQRRADYCNSREKDYANGTPISGDYCEDWYVNPASYGLNDVAVKSYCDNYKYPPRPGDPDYTKYMKICGCYLSNDECAETTDVRCMGGTRDSVEYEPAYKLAYQMNRTCPPITVCNSYMNNSGFQLFGEQNQECITKVGTTQNLMFVLFILIIIIIAITVGLVMYIRKRTPTYTKN
jgi:hypothetical protein